MKDENHERLQKEAFEQAKISLGEKLEERMRLWTFPQMLKELRKAIQSTTRPGSSKSARTFGRRFLGMSGPTSYMVLVEWLKEERLMTSEDIVRVFNTLLTIEGIQRAQMQKVSASNTQRSIIEHAITTINSCVRMMKTAQINSEHVFGSERMEVKKGLSEISHCFGIEAVFRDAPVVFERITLEDFSGNSSIKKP